MNRHLLWSLIRVSAYSFPPKAGTPNLSTCASLQTSKKKATFNRGPRPTKIPHPTSAEISYNPPDPRNETRSDGLNKDAVVNAKGRPSTDNNKNLDTGRVLATGTLSNAARMILPDEERDPNDGSLEMKEELSPGSVDKSELAKHSSKKSHKDEVPPEVSERLHEDTIELIQKESGLSSPGAGG